MAFPAAVTLNLECAETAAVLSELKAAHVMGKAFHKEALFAASTWSGKPLIGRLVTIYLPGRVMICMAPCRLQL